MTKNGTDYIPITQAMIDRLLALKTKTGTGYYSLYQYGIAHTHYPVFQEMTNTAMHHWVIGNVKTLNTEYYNQIIATYESLPKGYKGGARLKHVFVPEEFRTQLKQFVGRPRQMTLAKILNYAGAPKGLSPMIIDKIANGKAQTIQPEFLKFLEKLLNEEVA